MCTHVASCLKKVTCVKLMHVLYDGQEDGCLLFPEPVPSAEQHRVCVELEQNASLGLRGLHVQGPAQYTT